MDVITLYKTYNSDDYTLNQLISFSAGTILNDTIYVKKNNLNKPHYKNLVISAIVN